METLVAFMLLTAPPDAKVPPPTPDLMQRCFSLAVSMELLDVRESWHFERPAYFDRAVNMVRERRVELADAPPVQDCLRFPPEGWLREAYAFNYRFQRNAEHYRDWNAWSAAGWGDAQREAERIGEILCEARNGADDGYWVTTRRRSLKRLRELLGEEAYYHGRLPPSVPLWRFGELSP